MTQEKNTKKTIWIEGCPFHRSAFYKGHRIIILQAIGSDKIRIKYKWNDEEEIVELDNDRLLITEVKSIK